MNKYGKLLKTGFYFLNSKRSILSICNFKSFSTKEENLVPDSQKYLYIHWSKKLQDLINNDSRRKAIKEFINFFEFTSQLNLNFASDRARIMLEEYLEINKLDDVSDKEIASLLESFKNIHVSKEIFNSVKKNFINRNIQSPELYYMVFKSLLSKNLDDYETDDLYENIKFFYKQNTINLSNQNFIEVVQAFYYLYNPKYFEILSYFLDFIMKKINPNPEKIDQSSLLCIYSAYPRLLHLNNNEDLMRKELTLMQQSIEKISFHKTESQIILLNNISIYGRGCLKWSMFEDNLPNIYKFLTCIENENLFHLFFLLTSSTKHKNQVICKKILSEVVILVQYMKYKKEEETENFFRAFNEKCLNKINEIKDILHKRKSDIDIKYSFIFLDILQKAETINPITYADYSTSYLVQCYENLIYLLEKK